MKKMSTERNILRNSVSLATVNHIM